MSVLESDWRRLRTDADADRVERAELAHEAAVVDEEAIVTRSSRDRHEVFDARSAPPRPAHGLLRRTMRRFS